MMMTDPFTDRLSAYLDGDLDAADRAALEAHLRECHPCRTVLNELRAVTRWAASFPGRAPADDPWPAIEGAIKRSFEQRVGSRTVGSSRRTRSRRRFARVPLALASGLAVFVVGAGSWWLARATAPTVVSEFDVPSAPATVARTDVALLAAERYGAAIAELERVLLEEAAVLDTGTVQVLQEKMQIIDRAIREAREALSKDPNSDYLADHFTSLMRRKLSMLRSAAAAAVVQG